jgi:type II secretory pathway component PulF
MCLRGLGLTPVDIKETQAKAAKTAAGMNVTLFKQKVSHIDLLLFSRQMHTLLKSGVPIMRALNGLQDAAINPEMKRVIGEVRESLEGGRELSQALARHPRVFSPFYLSMVRVGEATGLLEEIFYRLFEHLEFERYMREQVKSALRYPMFVVIAMAAAYGRRQPFRHSGLCQGFCRFRRGIAADDAGAARLLQFHGRVLAGHARRSDRLCFCLPRLARNDTWTL